MTPRRWRRAARPRHLRLTNEGRAPTGVLLLEDHVPYALGTRPRFVLDGHRPGVAPPGRATRCAPTSAASYEIGPMTVRVTDPFGLVELGRAFHTSAPLTVTPRTVSLPDIPLGGAWTGSGDNRPRSFATGSAEDVTVREYRQGDDLRRVHWRSSPAWASSWCAARSSPGSRGPRCSSTTARGAHRGQGAASSLEAAVTAAASVALHLTRRGFMVRLVTAAGEEPSTAWHFRDARGQHRSPARGAGGGPPRPASPAWTPRWLGEAGHGGCSSRCSARSPATTGAILNRLQHQSGSPMAIALDVEAWSPHRAAPPARGHRAHRRGMAGGVPGSRRPPRQRVAGPRTELRDRAAAAGPARGGDQMTRATSLPHQLLVSCVAAATVWAAMLGWSP